MPEMNEIVASLKASLPRVCEIFGQAPSLGKILCPKHSERTASCKVEDDHFFCFGCKFTGDKIDAAAHMRGVTARDLIRDHAALMRDAEGGESGKKSNATTPAAPLAPIAPPAPEPPRPVRDLSSILGPGCVGMVNDGAAAFVHRRLPNVPECDLEHIFVGSALGLAPSRALDQYDERGVYRTAVEGYEFASPLYSVDAPGVVASVELRWVDEHKPRPKRKSDGSTMPKALSLHGSPGGEWGVTFGRLDLALEAARPHGRLVIAEGNIDLLTLRASSIDYSVGLAGASRAARLARYLVAIRYAGQIVLCMDADDAGEMAVKAFIDEFRKGGRATDGAELLSVIPGLKAAEQKDLNDLFRASGGGSSGARAIHALIDSATVVRARNASRLESEEAERAAAAELEAKRARIREEVAAELAIIAAIPVAQADDDEPDLEDLHEQRAATHEHRAKLLHSYHPEREDEQRRAMTDYRRTIDDGAELTDRASKRIRRLTTCGHWLERKFLEGEDTPHRVVPRPCQSALCSFCGGTWVHNQGCYLMQQRFWEAAAPDGFIAIFAPADACDERGMVLVRTPGVGIGCHRERGTIEHPEGSYRAAALAFERAARKLKAAGAGKIIGALSCGEDLAILAEHCPGIAPHPFLARAGAVILLPRTPANEAAARDAVPADLLMIIEPSPRAVTAIDLYERALLTLPLAISALSKRGEDPRSHPWASAKEIQLSRRANERGAGTRLFWMPLKKWKQFERQKTGVDTRPQRSDYMHLPTKAVLRPAGHSSDQRPHLHHELSRLAARDPEHIAREKARAARLLSPADAAEIARALDAALYGRARSTARTRGCWTPADK